MNAKELFDYYNTSKAHEHLSCSIRVAESFLNMYPQLQEMSLKDVDMYFYNFLYQMFFG